MKLLKPLFDNNRRWAGRIRQENPDFFEQLAKQQPVWGNENDRTKKTITVGGRTRL